MGLTVEQKRERMKEKLDLSDLLRWYCDRASDSDHPDGWLDYWSTDIIEDVRAAAERLDELEEEVRHSWD